MKRISNNNNNNKALFYYLNNNNRFKTIANVLLLICFYMKSLLLIGCFVCFYNNEHIPVYVWT